MWAPNAFLVYAGMRNYDHVPSVRKARAALAEQMRGMLLEQWEGQRHICENYSPKRGAANCTGDRFHQWGALAGFLSLGEAGDVTLPPLPKLSSIERMNRQSSSRQPQQGSSLLHSTDGPSRQQHMGGMSGGASPASSSLGGWAGWRSRSSGWYSWQKQLPWPWRGGESIGAAHSGVNPRRRAGSSSVGGGGDSSTSRRANDPTSHRPGYQQAADAYAAAKHDGRWPLAILEAVSRHVLGAFGAHGIVELDLDQSSELR